MQIYKDIFLPRLCIIFACLPLFSACGFQPLQARNGIYEGGIDLASVVVTVDSTRNGQLLEAELKDAINPDAAHHEKLYGLRIRITQTEVKLFINPDGTSARSDIPVTSEYQLSRLADGKLLDKGTISRVSSYNTSPTADYASYVSIQDAKKRGIMELAQSYKLRIANILARLQEQP